VVDLLEAKTGLLSGTNERQGAQNRWVKSRCPLTRRGAGMRPISS
jgi:hypothetical protein